MYLRILVILAIAAKIATADIGSPCVRACDCGLDSNCWDCAPLVHNGPKVCQPDPGSRCNDFVARTTSETCASDGECLGRYATCQSCTTDASCGTTVQLIQNLYNGVYLELTPFTSITCLRPICRTTWYGRHCCDLTPIVGKPCNDLNASRINDVCHADAVCRGTVPGQPIDPDQQFCAGVTACNGDGDCSAYPLTTASPCIVRKCSTSHVCTAGPAAVNTPCGTHSEKCDAYGKCIGCATPADCSYIPVSQCQNRTCSAGICGVVSRTNLACGLHGGKCDASGNCVECAGPSDCTSFGTLGDCEAWTCGSNHACFTIPTSGGSCASGRGTCALGACSVVQCNSPSDCTSLTVSQCQTKTCASGICGVSPLTNQACGQHGGKCDASGNCVECAVPSDCKLFGTIGDCEAWMCGSNRACSVVQTSGGSCSSGLGTCVSGVCTIPPCASRSDCNYLTVSQCQDYACSPAGKCTVVPLTGQSCGPNSERCDSNGNCVECGTWTDCSYLTVSQCQNYTCDSGTCKIVPLSGNSCENGGSCDALGSCVVATAGCGCTTPADCPQNKYLTCVENDCIAGKCSVTPFAPGTACDDGNDGTFHDVCDGMGGCAGVPISCTDPSSPCANSTLGQCWFTSCDAAGICHVWPKRGGGAYVCDDRNPQSITAHCDGHGNCVGIPNTCYGMGSIVETVCTVTPDPAHPNQTITSCLFYTITVSAHDCLDAVCFDVSCVDPLPYPNATACTYTPIAANTPCISPETDWTNPMCDGNGNCVGTYPQCTNPTSACATHPLCHTPWCDGSGKCHDQYSNSGTDCTQSGADPNYRYTCDGAGTCIASNPLVSCSASLPCAYVDCWPAVCLGGACVWQEASAGIPCSIGTCDSHNKCVQAGVCLVGSQCTTYSAPPACTPTQRPIGYPCSGGACDGYGNCHSGICGTDTSTCHMSSNSACTAVGCVAHNCTLVPANEGGPCLTSLGLGGCKNGNCVQECVGSTASCPSSCYVLACINNLCQVAGQQRVNSPCTTSDGTAGTCSSSGSCLPNIVRTLINPG